MTIRSQLDELAKIIVRQLRLKRLVIKCDGTFIGTLTRWSLDEMGISWNDYRWTTFWEWDFRAENPQLQCSGATALGILTRDRSTRFFRAVEPANSNFFDQASIVFLVETGALGPRLSSILNALCNSIIQPEEHWSWGFSPQKSHLQDTVLSRNSHLIQRSSRDGSNKGSIAFHDKSFQSQLTHNDFRRFV